MDSSKVIFEMVPFDAEHFGFPCAIFNIPVGAIVTDSLLEKIRIKQAAENIKFLTVVSQHHIPTLSLQQSGTLYEYECFFDQLNARASLFPGRFVIKPFTNEGWEDILALMVYRSENRFSMDTHLNKYLAFNHKVELYKHQLQQFPYLAFLAYSTDGKPLGFNICMLLNKGSDFKKKPTLIFYDLVVRPEYRSGVVALDLVNASIKAAREASIVPAFALTKIYDSNKSSNTFFENLGFTKNGKTFKYYHLWL